MSDETTTHEQLTETRSWSEYDEDGNVTADHTTVRAICGTCYREQIDRHGHLEYVRADWPCDGADNARLRERVAALTAAGTAMAEAIDAHHERLWRGSIGQASARTGLLAPRAAWHAALAQADDGGRA